MLSRLACSLGVSIERIRGIQNPQLDTATIAAIAEPIIPCGPSILSEILTVRLGEQLLV